MNRSGRIAGWSAAFAALLAFVLCCCSRQGDRSTPGTASPHTGGLLTVLSEPAQSLDPVLSDEVYEAVVDRQIYEGLVALDAGLRLQPALATSWTISPDGLVYTFSIRSGVRFHDGSALDAGTIVSSLERCLSQRDIDGTLAAASLGRIRGVEEFRAGRCGHVEGIRAKDDRTIEIELAAPLSIFLKVLAMEQTAIVARAVSGSPESDYVESNPIGTGPFRFVHREANGHICLGRFDGYWGQRAYVDSLIFVSEPRTAEDAGAIPFEIQALRAGRIKFTELPSGTSAQARAAGFSVYRSPELAVSFMGLRCDRAPFDIPEVREAALLAIRRDALSSVDPEGMVPASGLLPPGMPGRDPRYAMPKPDPERAKQLLAQCGHPAGRGLPRCDLGVSRTTNPRLYQPIVDDLRAIGLDVRAVPLDWRDLDSLSMGGRLPAFMMSWVADLPDPDAYLYPLFHSTGQSNLFGYRSARADSLLELGQTLPAGPERNQIYQSVQDIVLLDVPMVPLYHNSLAYAWDPSVNGIEIGPCGFAFLSFRAVWVQEGEALASLGGSR